MQTTLTFSAPRSRKIILFGGLSRPELAFSAPRSRKFFLFGGLFQAALAFSAPRFKKIFLFGGLSRQKQSFSAPRFKKIFLFGGSPDRQYPARQYPARHHPPGISRPPQAWPEILQLLPISRASLLYRNTQITEDRSDPIGAARPIG